MIYSRRNREELWQRKAGKWCNRHVRLALSTGSSPVTAANAEGREATIPASKQTIDMMNPANRQQRKRPTS